MQLFFHENIESKGETLKIEEAPEIIRQLRKVLRASAGYIFCVQNRDKRREVELINWTDKEINAKILNTQIKPQSEDSPAMLIALPNKQDKLELIIQKLTEIWITRIVLRSAERSVVKSFSANKQERLQKIMQEALEQSRGWTMPKIEFVEELSTIVKEYQIFVFDLKENLSSWETSVNKPLIWVIGPEGWLTEKDYARFGTEWRGMRLGEQVLRMETAAIVGGWLIKQGKVNQI